MGIFGGKSPDAKPDEAPAATPVREPVASALRSAAVAAQTTARSSCVIGARTVIKGEIGGDEGVVVEGRVEGQIHIGHDLQVAPGGTVQATVEARSVVIAGEIVGDVSATTRVEIQPTGRLIGNIRAPKVVIAEGGLFKGNSDMSGRREEPRP
jgi:cytoskeletal protein CcmA (bactofilin family)